MRTYGTDTETKLVAGSRNSNECAYKPNSDNRPDSYCPLVLLEFEGANPGLRRSVCYRLSVISCTDTHSDILTHSTDYRRVRLVGVQIGLRFYLGFSTSSFSQRRFSRGVWRCCLSVKSHALSSDCRPLFLIITFFSTFIY